MTDQQRAARRSRVAILLTQLDLMAHKADVLSKYGVERIRDLTDNDLSDLFWDLEATAKHRPAKSPKPEVPPEVRAARSAVLNQLSAMGINCHGGNWQPVNDYLSQPRIAGKPLYDLDLEELTATAKKLRAIRRKFENQESLTDRIARDN